MRPGDLKGRGVAGAALAIALPLVAGAVAGSGCAPGPESMPPGRFPEQLVYVRSSDGLVQGGALFAAPGPAARPLAVVWVHGWGANFYAPTYVAIGRALAERGYTCLTVNTRMHDIGNVAGWRWGRRLRGGGYWGVASDQVLDLRAWVDLAEARGFEGVVLVGHSAGWAAVRRYQAREQDPRVVGLVLASGAVDADTTPPDPELLAEATRLVGEGRGDDLLRLPGRSFPSFVSAATFLDIAGTPPELRDFFGVHTPHPAVTRVRCPLLAFFGTRDDVGDEAHLELLERSVERLSRGPSRVETVMIEGADHMYTGRENQVAETIAQWADTLTRSRPDREAEAGEDSGS